MINKYFSSKLVVLLAVLFVCSSKVFSQAILNADGPGNTYELINSVLAPGNDVVENPECVHPEFGRHIAEVWDNVLNKYVFEFYIHVTPDNDRCIKFDRQRLEIKTYEPSPENLKGVSGETITYKWKFLLPVGFQPSANFTHLHQIKAVGGNADDPIFTLTARKGTPNKMELIHDNTTKVANVDLSLFVGSWVEAVETIKVDSINGTYSLVIKKVSNGATILSFSSSKLMTIRYNNDFIRPKWGIYRSLLSPQDLRDEALRFSDFSIQEGITSAILPVSSTENLRLKVAPNPVSKNLIVDYYLQDTGKVQLDICDLKGRTVRNLIRNNHALSGNYTERYDVSTLNGGLYLVRLVQNNSTCSEKLYIQNN